MISRRLSQGADLRATARELATQFETQLVDLIPHIYRERVKEFSVTITGSTWAQFFKPETCRILLSIKLSDRRDLTMIKSMAERFVKDYLAQPEKRNYLVKVLITLFTQEMENSNV